MNNENVAWQFIVGEESFIVGGEAKVKVGVKVGVVGCYAGKVLWF